MAIVVGDEGLIGGYRWGLWLANSNNLSIIAPLSLASSISLDISLNRPGRLSFNFPLAHEYSVEFIPVRTCVILTLEGNIVWSGPIMSMQESLPDEQLGVVAIGWLELLYHRILTAELTFEETTRGQIIFGLLADANVEQPTWITQGTDLDDAPPITKTFNIYDNIGQAIEQITSLEAGPDVTVDPETRVLDVHAWNDYVDQTRIIWAYGWGPSNVENFSRSIDADGMINAFYVLGKNNNVIGHLAEDAYSQNYFRRFESQQTLSSVGDPDILAAFGEAEVVFRGKPRVTHQFQPSGGEDMPMLFEDFQLGDKCYLKAKFEPRIHVEQAVRVFSVTLQIDENGNAKLTNVVTVAS